MLVDWSTPTAAAACVTVLVACLLMRVSPASLHNKCKFLTFSAKLVSEVAFATMFLHLWHAGVQKCNACLECNAEPTYSSLCVDQIVSHVFLNTAGIAVAVGGAIKQDNVMSTSPVWTVGRFAWYRVTCKAL